LFYTDSVLVAYDWAADAPRSTGVNIADNTWKNVVLTYQSGVSNGTRIYINGVSVLTTTITVLNQTGNLFGGAEANAGQYAACQISLFNMYNRALSATEVLQNYNATKGRYR
jgi:hydroxymethylglutaryl-CoA reductase